MQSFSDKLYFVLFFVYAIVPNVYSQSDTLNRVTKKGVRYGYWVIAPPKYKKGYENVEKYMEGKYGNNGHQEGTWYTYNPNGTVRIETKYIDGWKIEETLFGKEVRTSVYDMGKQTKEIIKTSDNYCLLSEINMWLPGIPRVDTKFYEDECNLKKSVRMYGGRGNCMLAIDFNKKQEPDTLLESKYSLPSFESKITYMANKVENQYISPKSSIKFYYAHNGAISKVEKWNKGKMEELPIIP